MGRFEHGANVYTEDGMRRDLLDFSANLNPLGMPDAVVRALRDAAGDFGIYPDPECRALVAALARHHGVDAAQIVCTAGASDLIARLCLVVKPENALVAAPCFSGYEQALEQVGARILRHALRAEDDFAMTPRILQAFTADAPARPNLVFLCSPNNPTGLVIDRTLLVHVLRATRETGAIVMLDECFLDFTDEPSAVGLCGEFPNLVVLRAFTKTYAMAGLRLGYGVCADGGLVARLRAVGAPWAVSTPAQVAGLAALSEAGWVERSRVYVRCEREALVAQLVARGLRVVPGQANYLLFQAPDGLYEPLLERGILIRRCQNYPGLDDTWYRVAVRTGEENATLLAALDAALSEAKEARR
ncbi:MAG: histidinol-phosphate transaminase [Coriobacteriaceae bacterium]|nr:histidinol-phosphate transaminase [Coriobacteriaceae bacterium]